jgi:Ca-activated chloride channel family protein
MTFTWPWMLLSIGAIPLLVLGYRRLLRRRAARRSELAALGLVTPGTMSSGRRRHVGPALFLAAVALLFLALARPEATIAQAHREGTVVLAFDVSGSMAATDLAPSRIGAAKSAARTFVNKQPATVRVGVVAFSGSGLVTQQPTADRARVLAAIDRLTPQGGTALARGLQTSLSAIVGKTVQLNAPDSSVEPKGQDLGFHGSAAVILLSDGENTAETDPIDVAELASTAGVKIYPIGLGSPQGTVVEIDGFQVATALDEPLLRKIASTTDGRYFAAADEKALTKVYKSIDLAWTVRSEKVEITSLFAGAAAALLLLGAGLSLAWFGRAV